jgi:glycosyltransferase involved in cell wall biosynthesis
VSRESAGATPVVIDAHALTAGSGTGTYVRGLLSSLALHDEVEVTALCPPGATLPPGITERPLRRRMDRPRAALMEHSLRLPIELRTARRDGTVFHNPNFHAPPALGAPWVQTLHDLIPLLFDSSDTAALRARWKRFAPRYRRASAVIAVSHHVAASGIDLLGLDPQRVHVSHHGVGAEFGPGSSASDGPPYLLMVSEFSRRKGYAEAFAVMDALADAGYPHRLVVAGRVHAANRPELSALHAASRHPERIDIRGFVPDLVSLYQGASVFLMCSRYEGFGIPPLEAMASGVPVVAFANSAVTEVVGDGGQLVHDGDVASMTEAVRQIIDAPALAAEWRERGLDHVRPFTWEASASRHIDVYRSLSGGTP